MAIEILLRLIGPLKVCKGPVLGSTPWLKITAFNYQWSWHLNDFFHCISGKLGLKKLNVSKTNSLKSTEKPMNSVLQKVITFTNSLNFLSQLHSLYSFQWRQTTPRTRSTAVIFKHRCHLIHSKTQRICEFPSIAFTMNSSLCVQR